MAQGLILMASIVVPLVLLLTTRKRPYDCSLRLRCITSALTVLARKREEEQTFITINKTLTIGVLHIRSGTLIFALYLFTTLKQKNERIRIIRRQ